MFGQLAQRFRYTGSGDRLLYEKYVSKLDQSRKNVDSVGILLKDFVTQALVRKNISKLVQSRENVGSVLGCWFSPGNVGSVSAKWFVTQSLVRKNVSKLVQSGENVGSVLGCWFYPGNILVQSREMFQNWFSLFSLARLTIWNWSTSRNRFLVLRMELQSFRRSIQRWWSSLQARGVTVQSWFYLRLKISLLQVKLLQQVTNLVTSRWPGSTSSPTSFTSSTRRPTSDWTLLNGQSSLYSPRKPSTTQSPTISSPCRALHRPNIDSKAASWQGVSALAVRNRRCDDVQTLTTAVYPAIDASKSGPELPDTGAGVPVAPAAATPRTGPGGRGGGRGRSWFWWWWRGSGLVWWWMNIFWAWTWAPAAARAAR